MLSSSAGDGMSGDILVALYTSKARSWSSPLCALLVIVCFTVWMNLSALPFDWGFLGDEILCSKFHW